MVNFLPRTNVISLDCILNLMLKSILNYNLKVCKFMFFLISCLNCWDEIQRLFSMWLSWIFLSNWTCITSLWATWNFLSSSRCRMKPLISENWRNNKSRNVLKTTKLKISKMKHSFFSNRNQIITEKKFIRKINLQRDLILNNYFQYFVSLKSWQIQLDYKYKTYVMMCAWVEAWSCFNALHYRKWIQIPCPGNL